jgi:methylmalonyl-CoA mutase cobalamin-binding domain/chain
LQVSGLLGTIAEQLMQLGKTNRRSMMADFQAIGQCVIRGKVNKDSKYPPDLHGQDGAEELVRAALDEGASANEILQEGLIKGMEVVGKRFQENEIFVPDVLLAAKAMRAATDILKPYFTEGEQALCGTLIIGTVQGDLHDIGKNLVSMMVEGAGFKVIDLGVDVSPEKYVETAKENPDAVVGMSTLLTTTMPAMRRTIEALQAAGLPHHTIIGGAPVTEEYAKEIEATGYAPDPPSAIERIKQMIGA